jgi:hypothetical protein
LLKCINLKSTDGNRKLSALKESGRGSVSKNEG